MNILRVNMTTLEINMSPLPDEWFSLGGRGLSAAILNKEMTPAVDPLGKDAKLIFAGGPLSGAMIPSGGRLSAGAKSPLTMGIKEANVGGPAAQKLDRLGVRAIIVEGMPPSDQMYMLKIANGNIAIEEAGAYQGMKTYSLAEAIKTEYGNKAAVIAIGPAGEKQLKSAAIILTDTEGSPARAAARGGLGAVMGAKGLKAIVIDDKGAPPLPLKAKDAFREALRRYVKFVKSDPKHTHFGRIGTAIIVTPLRSIGSMPSKNFSNEETENFENLGGEAIEKTHRERGGKMIGCMPGCLTRCSLVYNDAKGKYLTSSLEYETLGLLGTNLGISDPDTVATMDRFCDEMGIDTVEIGAALGVAASAGKLTFGDGQSMLGALGEVESGTDLGIALGNGVVDTCLALGVERVPAYRGQAIPAHDPRVCKAAGVTYMTSPMGADHTAGMTYEDSLSAEGQVERSFNTQVLSAARDSLGHCLLATPQDRDGWLSAMAELINTRFGTAISADTLMENGRQTLRDEIRFNKGSEFHTAHEVFPEFILNEELAPNQTVFDVPSEEIGRIWDPLGIEDGESE